jgi:hypothetical protein
MDVNFAKFQRAYDLLTDEVLRSDASQLPQHLGNWFERLDDTAGIADLISSLEEALDFARWKAEREASIGSMVGSGELIWPKGRERRLGIQLNLFREIASGRIDAFDFGHNFFYAGNNINANVSLFLEQVFGPMARDLRLYIEERVEEAEDGDIPASDRIVRLDHNAPKYKEAMDALATLERVLQEANDYPDAEDKDQRIAEVSALRRLLTSTRVRVRAVVVLAQSGLAYLAKTFVTAGIGAAAKFAWEKLVSLLHLAG